ncbi:MAG: hypothetical protein IJK60_05335 [Clostridia bacterium]|nr:hypothetical protein [Clostridia bacterium]
MTVSLFFKMLTAFAMSIFTAFGGLFGGGEQMKICMIAHRGYSSKYYQNTELAFKGAAQHGSGGAETDIRVTSDGVYVTNHNSSVVLKDGTELEVADHTFAELTAQPLKQYKTLQDVYLCTYKRYLEIMKENNMICFIELKGDFNEEQVKEIFDMAAEVYSLDKCILQSFNFDNLIRAHELFPDLRIMLTYGSGDEGYERCFDYGFSIDCDYNVITEEMIEQFHSRGLEVGVWTANDPVSLAYCKSLGVDYIESDVF